MHRYGTTTGYCAVIILVISTLLIQNSCPNNLIGKFFPINANKERCCLKQTKAYIPINSGADTTKDSDKDYSRPGAIFLTLASWLNVDTFPEVLGWLFTKDISAKQATAKLPDKPPEPNLPV